MFRFLLLIALITSLYLGYNAVKHYDFAIQFMITDYQIETSLFSFIAFFILAQIVLMLTLKIIFFFLNIPSIIRDRWQRHKLHQINQKLITALAQMLMGNRKKSLDLANKLVSDFDKNNKEVATLVLAESARKTEKRVEQLKSLLDKKYFSAYAAKNLAQISYKNGQYRQAEEYATRAFNEDDTDPELMLILIRIYAALKNWGRMIFIVSKLKRADQKMLTEYSLEIAGYYYMAAKAELESGTDAEALKYLESALEIRPDYLEGLNLFVELSTNLNNSAAIVKMLKAAFNANPSFEIARMYAESASGSKDAIYGTLAGLAEPRKYPGLFLALAAYLGLNEKFSEIKL